MDCLGYTKIRDVKIIRAKHKITFRIGTRSIDLVRMLSSVPDEATVDEVIDSIEGSDITTIEFHEEKLLKDEAKTTPDHGAEEGNE